MKKIRALLVLFIAVVLMVAVANPVFATAGVDKRPIDIELEKKINADSSTYGMLDAYKWAEGEWDKELNKNYQALMKRLKKDEQAKLKASQRQWIKYRDAEFDFNGKFWSSFDGTARTVFASSFRSDFVRDRALQLGYYLADLDER